MDRRIWENIEACRPGSDDVRSAEMRELAREMDLNEPLRKHYEKVQAWDAAASDAMEQASVPPGLAARIMAQLELSAAGAAQTAPENVETEPVETLPSLQTQPSLKTLPIASRRTSRRRWLAIPGTVAACLAVGAFLQVWLQPRSDAPLESQADGWLASLSQSWKPLDEIPRDLAVPSSITASAVGWQTLGAPRGVAYKLKRGASTATLFVVKLPLRSLHLGAAPPFPPQSTTGGKTIGYWRNGQIVYVLVVDGNEGSYRHFVSTSAAPLA